MTFTFVAMMNHCAMHESSPFIWTIFIVAACVQSIFRRVTPQLAVRPHRIKVLYVGAGTSRLDVLLNSLK